MDTMYVIKVVQLPESRNEYVTGGYYTSIYTVNRNVFCGFDSDYNHYKIKKFTSRANAQNHIDTVLDKQEWGGETVTVRYDFEVEEIQTEKPQKQTSKITAFHRSSAKEILLDTLNHVYSEFNEYVQQNNISKEDSDIIAGILAQKINSIK